MKLISFLNVEKQERLGFQIGEKRYEGFKVGQHFGVQFPKTMHEFLQDTLENLASAHKLIKQINNDPLAPVATPSRLLSPIPFPSSCRDGYAFRQHVETMRKNRNVEMSPEFDQFPVFYFTNHQSISGEGYVHIQDDHLNQMDYELEVAVVIGKKGRNISADRADEFILGYTIMNDFSARLLQLEEMKLALGPAKGKDFSTTLGPWLVTSDELEPYKVSSPVGNTYNLAMKCSVNGKILSQGNLNTMNWTFAQLIERISYGVDIYPGDVIGSGTVGTGCLAELNGTGSRLAKLEGTSFSPTWLQENDVIDMEVTGLGHLSNTLKKDPAPYSILTYLKK